jgi:hypothetical protein
VISIVRFKSLYDISISQDVSWDNVPIADWTADECNIGIMCVCLPTLKPLPSVLVLPHALRPRRLRQRTELLQHQSFGRSTKSRTDKHAIFTEARRPGFAIGRIGLFPAPAKTLSRPTQRKIGDDNSLSDIEEGHIKVNTVVEQEVGDESENISQRKLV